MSKKEIDLTEAYKMAEAHVDWYQRSQRQPMIDEFVHGFKHGVEFRNEEAKEESKNLFMDLMGDRVKEYPRGTVFTRDGSEGWKSQTDEEVYSEAGA